MTEDVVPTTTSSPTTEASLTTTPPPTATPLPDVPASVAPTKEEASIPSTTVTPLSKTSAEAPESASSLPLILGLTGGVAVVGILVAVVIYRRSNHERASSAAFKAPDGEPYGGGVSPSMHRTHNSSMHNTTFLGSNAPFTTRRAPSSNQTPVHALTSSPMRSNQALWDVLLGRDTITSNQSPNVPVQFGGSSIASSSVGPGTYSESHLSSFDSSRGPSSHAISECSDIYPSSGSLFRMSSLHAGSESSEDMIEMEL
ncbi:hypothetical protein SPRG_18014 [Saprolegnia parasitica CBS 223.65]|uniref:Uncharacterized protein n=1 Tax=Saprolegnia parasitica (strain CBS 223.65) TaxID=695850 RepID=A0A067BDL8_SAPPC|nr:hypothetical protein SPRG_18014 [Saprolegnia parasitica CBS 223.65]KDO16459.1 hypothetical protein SPRG_18014 [Saprolegnia parasitica CBS 223.65]|eukprot:XP_012212832.1 hypothetical protein SPRG_18014 [Saprolegnia parasitica CBS 223.65]